MEYRGRRSTVTQLPFQRLLQSNDLGIIENPLRRIHEDDLDLDIQSFHTEYKLADVVDVDVLVRGGRLARDEEATLIEGNLHDIEKKALNKEKTSNIWKESKELKIILLTCKQFHSTRSTTRKGIDSRFLQRLHGQCRPRMGSSCHCGCQSRMVSKRSYSSK